MSQGTKYQQSEFSKRSTISDTTRIDVPSRWILIFLILFNFSILPIGFKVYLTKIVIIC